MNELKNIKRIANINGYADEEIELLVEKHSRKIKKLAVFHAQLDSTIR